MPGSRSLRPLPLVLLLSACATGGGPPADVAPAAAGTAAVGPLPPAIHWVRNSAEHRAAFVQIYRDAGERLSGLARGRSPGTWAVILDADETVLDNSTYQRRLAARGAGFSTETWNAWVREEAATAKPGAGGFIAAVREMGGRVAIVTNRDEEVCDATRGNLAALDLRVDVVLCQQPGEQGKEARFRAVEEGTTPAGLPGLEVLLWLGDNIHDFPGLDQEIRNGPASDFGLFGRRYFLFPNPMYGSWEGNPAS